jgi:hypothetical protein
LSFLFPLAAATVSLSLCLHILSTLGIASLPASAYLSLLSLTATAIYVRSRGIRDDRGIAEGRVTLGMFLRSFVGRDIDTVSFETDLSAWFSGTLSFRLEL